MKLLLVILLIITVGLLAVSSSFLLEEESYFIPNGPQITVDSSKTDSLVIEVLLWKKRYQDLYWEWYDCSMWRKQHICK